MEPLSVDVRLGIRIPLRDGIHLGGTLYSPAGGTDPSACILLLTPYTTDLYHERGMYFAAHGLRFLAVDVRGRGDSEGVFRPLTQEARDGYDAVEWLARQPFCNGKVAMWGGSYNGYVQWATASEFPPHLATFVPAASLFPGLDFPMRNNIFHPYVVQWLAFTSGHALQTALHSDKAFWSSLYREWHESGRPFRELETVLGRRFPAFREWLAHPEPDPYWDALNPTAEQYARLGMPILTITGSYDDDQPGALEHYRRHLLNAPVDSPAQHYLIIGPWDHAGTRTPSAQFGGLTFGAASLLDLPGLHLEWYRWTMGGGPKPGFLEKPVAYYVMGAECWRHAETLAAITAREEPCFLGSKTRADDALASGSLGAEAGSGAPDSYVYDPRDTRGPEVQAEARGEGGSLVDQGLLLALRGRQLVYETTPFDRDMEVSGFFRLVAWIAIDRPDTDFYVSVHEVDPDGGSIRLSTDAMRARHRAGLRTTQLIATDEPLLYEFQRFTFVSRRVSTGHRLRLVVAPVGRLAEATFTQKNYNGGGVVADESVRDAQPVTVRLFHDRAHPSVLYIPIGQPESAS